MMCNNVDSGTLPKIKKEIFHPLLSREKNEIFRDEVLMILTIMLHSVSLGQAHRGGSRGV